MFSQRNGSPFPAGWWVLALMAVILTVITVALLLAAIWVLSWQALATAVVTGILAVIAGFGTGYWADDMS